MVLLIASEGKKWGLYYNQPQIGGKKWGTVVCKSGGKCGKGIVPPSTSD